MVRDHALVLAVTALTSLLAVLVARRGGGRRLGPALVIAVEVVGATMLFFAANLAIGAALVLTLRRLTPLYPSLYEMADIAVLVLSLFQALISEAWRQTTRRDRR